LAFSANEMVSFPSGEETAIGFATALRLKADKHTRNNKLRIRELRFPIIVDA